LTDPVRVEVMRSLTRDADCTKALYAAGGMIVARAGDIEGRKYVASPVPLTVNNREISGKGEVVFAWALPLAHMVPPNPKLIQTDGVEQKAGDSRKIPTEGP
jgi:hypothetical protein